MLKRMSRGVTILLILAVLLGGAAVALSFRGQDERECLRELRYLDHLINCDTHIELGEQKEVLSDGVWNAEYITGMVDPEGLQCASSGAKYVLSFKVGEHAYCPVHGHLIEKYDSVPHHGPPPRRLVGQIIALDLGFLSAFFLAVGVAVFLERKAKAGEGRRARLIVLRVVLLTIIIGGGGWLIWWTCAACAPRHNVEQQDKELRDWVILSRSDVPTLINALRDRDPGVRTKAAQRLGKTDPAAKDAVLALIETLKDAEPWVRAAAAFALGRVGPAARDAVPALIEALKDEHSGVRTNAATALGWVGADAKAVVPALIEALGDEYKGVRLNTAISLSGIGPEARDAVPALIEALKDEDDRVRSSAQSALDSIRRAKQ